MPSIAVHPEVDDALRSNRPVVALETAVLTHGLPRSPLADPPPGEPQGWNRDSPLNLETARAMQRGVHDGGAVPATVGVLEGTLHIGLDDESLQRLAADVDAQKASTANLADTLTSRGSAGTTVSATLAACSLIEAGPIRVFATGGIGGVHRRWTARPDISADLRRLATTPACVVCSGSKSILDLPATVELLETLGVPLIGYRTGCFPRFHALGDERLRTPQRADDPQTVARVCRTQWHVLRQSTGVLVANPVPADAALPGEELDAAVLRANAAADAQGIGGPDRTPYLLAELSRLTEGRSLRANIALLLHNACLAAAVAVALTECLDTPRR